MKRSGGTRASRFEVAKSNLSIRLPVVEIVAIRKEAAARGLTIAELIRRELRPLLDAALGKSSCGS